MRFINCTSKTWVLFDASSPVGREFPPSGNVAEVAIQFTPVEDDLTTQEFGDVSGLPDPEADTLYIVDPYVFNALQGLRADVVKPATGHPGCHTDRGMLISIPGFVRSEPVVVAEATEAPAEEPSVAILKRLEELLERSAELTPSLRVPDAEMLDRMREVERAISEEAQSRAELLHSLAVTREVLEQRSEVVD